MTLPCGRIADELATELLVRESHVLEDDRLQEYIGIPRALRAVLAELNRHRLSTVGA